MKRNPKILGQVVDVEGGLWDVRQIRDTHHGFDLLFGSPARPGIYRGGLPRLIATRPLADFWEANQTKHSGILFDLPAGRTTLKRVRRRLGFNYFEDLDDFWRERMDDLKSLRPREFARRHSVPVEVVVDTRRKLLGSFVRPLGWWREPEFLEVLRSHVPLRVMGEKLGISITHAKRLRDRARLEHQRPLPRPPRNAEAQPSHPAPPNPEALAAPGAFTVPRMSPVP
jgi:hypothetical protein